MKKNKKIIIIISVIVILLIAIILFLSLKSDKLPFNNNSWCLSEGEILEKITLNPDGDFNYYTTGEDKYNLAGCDSYKYNKKTKTIKLSCSKEAKITEIKIVKYSEEELVLKISKEQKTFQTSES